MPEEAKVEKFKITKEMMSFAKNFKKIQKISTQLQQRLEVQLGEADETRKMLQDVEFGRQLLLENPPKNPTHEVEGMELEQKNLELNL